MILLSAIAAVTLFIAGVVSSFHALGRKTYRRTDQVLTVLSLLSAAAVASLVAFAIPLDHAIVVWAVAFVFVINAAWVAVTRPAL